MIWIDLLVTGVEAQPQFGLLLRGFKSLHSYFGYVLFVLGFIQLKLGMDEYPLKPSEVIPQYYFWAVLAFWLTLFALLEVFYKQTLQKYCLQMCCQHQRRTLGKSNRDIGDQDPNAHITFDDDEDATIQDHLLSDFEDNWQGLMKYLGDSFVRQFFHQIELSKWYSTLIE